MIKALFFVFAVLSADGANEGDVCNAKSEQGICMKINRCPTAVDDVKQGIIPRPCGTDKSIICCKTDGRVLTTTKRSSAPTTTEYTPKEYDYVDKSVMTGDRCKPVPSVKAPKKNGQKAWDKCIEYQEKYVFPCEKTEALIGSFGRKSLCHHNVDELIIDGSPAAKWEFPHMVLLGYKNEQNDIIYQCGGALISEKFILTAGHCISDVSRNDVSHALIGVLKRSDESIMNRYGIKRIIKHDSYQSPTKYHDIALLELDRAVTLNHTVVPACLHTGDPVDDSRASVAGWGTTVHNKKAISNELLKVVLSKFSAQECATLYEPERHREKGYDEKTQVCFGDRTTTMDTCQGDSGGPLQIKSKLVTCMYTVIGVTSFGMKCGLAGTPGIYTRVSAYLPWIESIVWPN